MPRLRTLNQIFETVNHPCDCMDFNSLVAEKYYEDDGTSYYVLRYSIAIDEQKIIESGYLRTTNAEHIRKFKSIDAVFETANKFLDKDVTSEIWFTNPSLPETESDARQMGLI